MRKRSTEKYLLPAPALWPGYFYASFSVPVPVLTEADDLAVAFCSAPSGCDAGRKFGRYAILPLQRLYPYKEYNY